MQDNSKVTLKEKSKGSAGKIRRTNKRRDEKQESKS